MTKERLEIMKELAAERDRNGKLDESVQLLKKQAEIYQVKKINGIIHKFLNISFYLETNGRTPERCRKQF